MAKVMARLPEQLQGRLTVSEIEAIVQYMPIANDYRLRAAAHYKHQEERRHGYCSPLSVPLHNLEMQPWKDHRTEELFYLICMRAASPDWSAVDVMAFLTDLFGANIFAHQLPRSKPYTSTRMRDLEINLRIYEWYWNVPLVPHPYCASFVQHLDTLAGQTTDSYVPAACLVQSSGSGKTRTATAVADFGPCVIYESLAASSSTGYPRPMPDRLTDTFRWGTTGDSTVHTGVTGITLLHAAVVASGFLTAAQFRDLQIVKLSMAHGAHATRAEMTRGRPGSRASLQKMPRMKAE
ncbi:hypothetical protein GGF32_007435 [Allomyces javanicus]|nr:hypothetical protein GGF32_007435 [Allomyces javanicus]